MNYESDNRRAEIHGDTVQLFRITGNVRRSKEPVWPAVTIPDKRKRVVAARQWAERGKISKYVN